MRACYNECHLTQKKEKKKHGQETGLHEGEIYKYCRDKSLSTAVDKEEDAHIHKTNLMHMRKEDTGVNCVI